MVWAGFRRSGPTQHSRCTVAEPRDRSRRGGGNFNCRGSGRGRSRCPVIVGYICFVFFMCRFEFNSPATFASDSPRRRTRAADAFTTRQRQYNIRGPFSASMRDASAAHGVLPPVEKRRASTPAHQQRRRSSHQTATQCVFGLIKRTTPVLVVKREPVVNESVVRYREAVK